MCTVWRVCLLARAGLACIPLRPRISCEDPHSVHSYPSLAAGDGVPLEAACLPRAQSAPTHTHAGWRQKFISCSSEAEKFRIKEQVPSVSGECPFPESWMASFPGRRARTAPREEPWSPPKAPLGPFPRLHLPARSLRGWGFWRGHLEAGHAYQAWIPSSPVPISRAVPVTSGGRGRLCHFRLPGFNTQLWLLIQAFC